MPRISRAFSRQVPLRAGIMLALVGAAIGGVAMAGRSAPGPHVPEDLRAALVVARAASDCLHLADTERVRASGSGASFEEVRALLAGCDDALIQRMEALHRPDQQGPVYTAVMTLYEIEGSVDHAIFHIEEDMKGVPAVEADTTAVALRDVDDLILQATDLIGS